jgi:hypothetical protein
VALAELKFARRYRYRIAGGIKMRTTVDQKMASVHGSPYASTSHVLILIRLKVRLFYVVVSVTIVLDSIADGGSYLNV